MHIPEAGIARLADEIVRVLVKPGFIVLKATEKQVAERIRRLIIDNLRVEEALEEEAERMAAKLGRQGLGMDQYKLIEGIKQRLAKERGFTL
jgi:hypothetical protein